MSDLIERLRGGDTRKCPFPDTDIEPDQPCPVCGDLGTFDPDNLDKPIRCVASSSRLLLDEAATALSEAKAENERLREALNVEAPPHKYDHHWNIVRDFHPDGEAVWLPRVWGKHSALHDGKLFKRREVRADDLANKPIHDFEVADHDMETGKVVGWVPVGDAPEDRWHREAFERETGWPNGTYELVGPKVQGNPEATTGHKLIAHDSDRLVIQQHFDRTFEGIRDFLAKRDMEGIVFHHPDGRMAKIKKRDFGLKRIPT